MNTNKLTDEEIHRYMKPANKSEGVDAITREMLESIDLDKVPDLVRDGERLKTPEGKNIYKLDRFVPRSGSYAFKPSFAGRQVLLGKQDRDLFFSNGRWFVSSI